MFKKCNCNFQSQYAFIANEPIHIDELQYRNDRHNLKCINGHPLVFANGIKNKPHLRHKNNEDLDSHPMTEWHCEWQGNFPITEVEYKIINETSRCCIK